MGRKCKGETWWSNEEMEAISRMKDAPRVMCRNSTEKNKNRYKSMNNKEKKVAGKAMRDMAEDEVTELRNG